MCLCGLLSVSVQHLKRTGWVNHGVKDPETVAGHMYRMAMMCFLFEGADNGVSVKAGPGSESEANAGSGACSKPLDRERCDPPRPLIEKCGHSDHLEYFLSAFSPMYP